LPCRDESAGTGWGSFKGTATTESYPLGLNGALPSVESTAESLRAVARRQAAGDAADRANLKLMLDNLHQTFEKFTKAEDQFWDALDSVSGE